MTTPAPPWLLSELAIMVATLSGELWRNGQLSAEGASVLAGSLDRIAEALESHDPTDPDELTAAAAGLHSAAILIRRDRPENPQ